MALEDLFRNVTKRFNDDTTAEHEPMFKCPCCQQSVPESQFQEQGKVCPNCNYHARLTAAERLRITADKNSFVEYDAGMHSADPLHFPDYAQKIERSQTQTGMRDAVITGECTIKGSCTVLIIMDSHFMMASMGSVVGEKITRAFETATEKGLPVVAFTASGGARMQEGILSPHADGKDLRCRGSAQRGRTAVPHSDDRSHHRRCHRFVCIAGGHHSGRTQGAHRLRRTACHRGTIRQRLPDNFQLAEFVQEKGFVDMIVERRTMRSTLSHLLKLHGYERENG